MLHPHTQRPPSAHRPPISFPPPSPLNLHPQLVRYDQGGLVERFLLDAAQRSVYFAHMLICQLLSEGTPPEEAFNPAVRGQGRRGGRMDRHGHASGAGREAGLTLFMACPLIRMDTLIPLCIPAAPQVKRSNWSPPVDTGLWGLADRLRAKVCGAKAACKGRVPCMLWPCSWPETPCLSDCCCWACQQVAMPHPTPAQVLQELHGPVRERLDAELQFFDRVTAVSGKLYPVPKVGGRVGNGAPNSPGVTGRSGGVASALHGRTQTTCL